MRRQWFGIWAALFLGITFVIAGGSKVFDQSGRLEPLRLPEFLSPPLAQAISAALPYVEIIVGVLLILGIAVKFTTSFSALMIVGFITSNIILVNLGLATEPCGCFGGIAGGGISVSTSLILDGVMAVAVSFIFMFHRSSIKPWYLTTEQNTVGDMPILKGGLNNEQSS